MSKRAHQELHNFPCLFCAHKQQAMGDETYGHRKGSSASSSAIHPLALMSIYLTRFNSVAHHYLRASSVLLFSEGLLGSPIPIRLAATTRNSYSTQGFRPTTVAVNVLPSMISGTRRQTWVRNAIKPTKSIKDAVKRPCIPDTLRSEGLM